MGFAFAQVILQLWRAMKIATFNINNINKRLANLLAWLRKAKPDVVALQELKAADADFPKRPSKRPVMARFGGAKSRGTASRSSPAAASPF
jgi:exonuclease III